MYIAFSSICWLLSGSITISIICYQAFLRNKELAAHDESLFAMREMMDGDYICFSS